jgi:hypothetical protein
MWIETLKDYDDDDYVYIYSSCTGYVFVREEEQTFEEMQCSVCGDSDTLEDCGLVKDLRLKTQEDYE